MGLVLEVRESAVFARRRGAAGGQDSGRGTTGARAVVQLGCQESDLGFERFELRVSTGIGNQDVGRPLLVEQHVLREAVSSNRRAEFDPERLERVHPRRVACVPALVARNKVLVELGHVVQNVKAQQLLWHYEWGVLELTIVDDVVVVDGSSMCTKNYNSFPECAEVMLDEAGKAHLIRRRQPVEEIWSHEVEYKP